MATASYNQCTERGALAAIARKERVSPDSSLWQLRDRLLLVDDAIEALQKLACI